jgi:hypothetical protein
VRIAINPKSDALRARADAVFEPDLTGAVAWLAAHGYLPSESASQRIDETPIRHSPIR